MSTGLKLDFTAHGRLESLSEFGLCVGNEFLHSGIINRFLARSIPNVKQEIICSIGNVKYISLLFWSSPEIKSYSGWFQGVTKRCRLPWLANSALVCEPKCGGMGKACWSQPVVHMDHKKLWRSNLWLGFSHGFDGSLLAFCLCTEVQMYRYLTKT